MGVKQQAERTRAEVASEKLLQAREFTEEEFAAAWQLFYQKLEESKRTFRFINLQEVPKCSENIVFIEVSSEMAKNELLSIREELLQFLGEHLKNYHIELQIEINLPDIPLIVKTSEEKQREILSEYPLLLHLKKTFDLYFE